MKLFLDDERFPIDDSIIVRSVEEAIDFVQKNGCPSYISFDNDLGLELEGIDFAQWLVEQDLDNPGFIPNDFSFYVHSQNPIARDRINSLLTSYLEHRSDN